MDDSARRLSQAETEAFSVLILRYLDGACEEAEIDQLKATLADSATHRQLFAQLCCLHGEMHEAFAQQRALRQKKAAVPEEQAVSAASGAKRSTSSSLEPNGLTEELPQEVQAPDAPKEKPDETVVHGLSMEDTIFPETKPPEQQ